VKSLEKGLKTVRRQAGITKTVSPHIFRHSAAVHMAENGRSMEQIQQFRGHSEINVTRKIYARFSPSYLKEAAAALDDLGPLDQRALPEKALPPLKTLGNLVADAVTIEPVSPCKFGNCRVIRGECRDGPRQGSQKHGVFKHFD
jgi:hypothetical protein